MINTLKFLLISDSYPPVQSASGNIAKIICCQLLLSGHKVDILSRHESKEKYQKCQNGGESVYYIKYCLWERLHRKYLANDLDSLQYVLYSILKYLRKIYLFFNIRYFPNTEFFTTKKSLRACEALLKRQNYDCVISFFRSYSSLAVGYELKRKGKIKYFIPYYLDLVEEKDCPSVMPLNYFQKKIRKYDADICKISDIIVLPMSAKKNIFQDFSAFSNKLLFLNFPTALFKDGFVRKNTRLDNKERIVFLFAGTLSKKFRSPEKTLKIINKLAEAIPSKEFVLDVFGRNDCEKLINEIPKRENFKVRINGVVSKEDIEKREDESDFLVNITNDYNGIVPSKTFELLSTSKYILNSITSGDDGSLQYFFEHPLSFNIDKINSDCQKLVDFIQSGNVININRSELIKKYEQYTPEYIVNNLLRKLEEFM